MSQPTDNEDDKKSASALSIGLKSIKIENHYQEVAASAAKYRKLSNKSIFPDMTEQG